MEHEIWRREADGHLSAEVPGLKLIVRKLDNCARYVFLRRADDRSYAEDMLSSGTEPSVDAAIGAARRAAARIGIILTERSRLVVHVDLRRLWSVAADTRAEG